MVTKETPDFVLAAKTTPRGQQNTTTLVQDNAGGRPGVAVRGISLLQVSRTSARAVPPPRLRLGAPCIHSLLPPRTMGEVAIRPRTGPAAVSGHLMVSRPGSRPRPVIDPGPSCLFCCHQNRMFVRLFRQLWPFTLALLLVNILVSGVCHALALPVSDNSGQPDTDKGRAAAHLIGAAAHLIVL